jgi:hypothetical protein
MHVKGVASGEAWSSFPHVREMLAPWGIMGSEEPTAQIEAKLGVRVTKVEIKHSDPVRIHPQPSA